jgi:hypothetical protein
MQIGYWTVTAVVFALAEVAMIIVVCMVGVVLRMSQGFIAGTSMFGFAREHGLRKSARLAARMLIAGEPGALAALRKEWLTIAISAWALLLAGTGIAVTAALTLAFLPFSGSLHANRFPAAVTVFATGIIAAAWFLVDGLAYAARAAKRRRGSLPRITLPGLTNEALDGLALRIYWYSRLNPGSAIAAVVFPWLLHAVTAVSTPGGVTSGPEPVAETLGSLAVAVLSFLVPLTAIGPLERISVISRVSAEACALLDPPPPGRRPGPSGLIADPLGYQRRWLALLAAHVADAARALDSQQEKNAVPHLASTLLRAVAEGIRRFLRGK